VPEQATFKSRIANGYTDGVRKVAMDRLKWRRGVVADELFSRNRIAAWLRAGSPVGMAERRTSVVA